jgi:HAD superfamily hydrolase (TIGR01509 family)
VTGSVPRIEARGVRTVLCDADGTLFPSEEPAYDASALVTQAFAERYGLVGNFSAGELRRTGTGRNFRALATDLLAEAGVAADPAVLEEWVERERLAVTAHLAATLRPNAEVVSTVSALHRRYRLAVVSSSATPRLLTCLHATGLADAFDVSDVFSAEDSMPTPVSKPDPAIYRHALAALGASAGEALAIEDSPTGVRSAVAAGVATVGIVCFVPPNEVAARTSELVDAGAGTVVDDWRGISALLLGHAEPTDGSSAVFVAPGG